MGYIGGHVFFHVWFKHQLPIVQPRPRTYSKVRGPDSHDPI